jgi:intracellular sulfur oxidation DsrE/DsrF family protein
MRDIVLSPLVSRACDSLELKENSVTCQVCRATIREMESDLAALYGLKAQVIARVQELIAPPKEDGVRTVRVRLAEFFVGPLDSKATVEEAIKNLRDHLLKLSEEGVNIVVE